MFSRDNNSLPGVILLAHGSSEPEAAEEIRELCKELSTMKPQWRFTEAFLNQEPKLTAALEALILKGCDSITVLPLLVFKGKHTLEDIPNQVEALRFQHPGLTIRLESHLSRLSGFREVLLQTLENVPPHNVPSSKEE